MKIISTVVIVAALAAFGAYESTNVGEQGENLRVMSFNIRYDNPNDGINAWTYRKERVVETIRFQHIDLLGIQEGLPHQVAYLEEQLPEYARSGIGRDGPKEGGEMSAVFYRKDRFDLLDHDTFWLSFTPEKASKGWDAALPRIVSWVKLRDTENERDFFFFNTHFDHVGENARKESARLIIKRIKEWADGYPVILTGDINTVPESEPYEILNGDILDDGFETSRYPHYGPTVTFPNIDRPFYVSPDSSRGRRIDYIFVNKKVDVLHHGILSNFRDGRFPSDHLPVVAEISFKKN